MIPILEGKKTLFIYADGFRQIDAAIQFSKRFKTKTVLCGVSDAAMALDIIKESRIPLIINQTNRLPNTDEEAYDLPYNLPKLLKDAGY